MFIRRKVDWLVVVVLVAGAFLYISYRPRFRLQTGMPPEFMDESFSDPPQKRGLEEKVARAYWGCLVNDIQWKYGYGHSLPQDPPSEFTFATQGVGDPENAATRVRYWRKAQQVWYLPSAWSKDYVWDFHWTIDWIQTCRDWLDNHLQFGGH
jgi:hypothetical protein